MLLFLMVGSCKKEIQLTQPLVKNKTLSVTELQQALNTNFTKNLGNSISTSKNTRVPNWLDVFSLKLKDSSNILSVPLSQNESDIKNGLKRRLVACKDSLGKIQMATMAIKPDSAYLKATKGNISLKTYTGDILFFTKEGVFMNGYVLANGKVIGDISLTIPTNPNNKANKGSTTQELVEKCRWVTSPDYNYVDDNGVVTIVAKWICTSFYKYTPNLFLPQETIDYIGVDDLGYLGGEPEPIIAWGEIDNMDGSTTLLSTNSDGNETHKVDWTCYKVNGNQLWFQSYDKVFITRYGYSDYYAFWKTEHQNITPIGALDAGQSAELIFNTATDMTTKEYAQIELSITEKRTIYLGNKTIVKYSGAKIARSRAWTLFQFGY